METITKNGRKYKLVLVDEYAKPYRLTITKNFDFEVYSQDLPETMTYLNAVKVAKKIGDGWRIPTKEELLLLYEYRNEIGGFCTEYKCGSGFPQWYWSCTERREDPAFVWNADFSDGNVDWYHKDSNRLSCRLVRLVPVAG